jgi:serine/threonine-protein kinase
VGDEVELPDIVEQPLDRAQAELDVHELGLHVAGRRADLRVPKDHVVAQDPAPFTTVKRGRRVYVTLSTGPPVVRVPKCVGDTERNARLVVEDAGLILGAVTYRASKKSCQRPGARSDPRCRGIDCAARTRGLGCL